MIKEDQIDKIINEVESEFEKINIPIMDKLTLFAKVQNALYKCGDLAQEPKMGKWIYRKEEDTYRCSLCSFPCHKDNMGAIPTRYCAECGAIMQEVEE